MVFTPDTDSNFQAYLFAKGLIAAEQRDQWIENFIQAYMLLSTNGATLVTNSQTRSNPNGTVATTIGQANASQLQNRNF